MPTLNRSRPRLIALAALTSLSLFASACSGATVTGPTPTPVTPTVVNTPTLAPTSPPSPTPLPEGLVASLQDVKRATIRIVSKGTFVDIGETAAASVAGSGSGFIIDPSGIAITNNHVVTGAALIEVYVGDETEPRNARVLGVSECSDLAVIAIEGDSFPYLEWHTGPVAAGMAVFTAGFPLGDPEYTITRGVVAKERADGESRWASVERTIEHDATIRPGSSGGPLVSEAGQVVAVNYAGNAANQFYAIGRDEALAIIDRLRAGENVTSLGLNGQAIKGENVSGIWVSSVASGSPLDRAGVQPGDFLTRLEGLELGADGTMADYCQILRSRDADDVLRLQAFRPSSGALLEGRINDAAGGLAPVVTATPTPEAAPSQVVAFEPGQIDEVQVRADADATRGQYHQLIFETFDRGWPTRRSWREDADSILRDDFYRLIVREPNLIRSVFWRPDGKDRTLGDNYIIELEVAFDVKGATGGVGFVFDGQNATDGLHFIIRSDNTWQVIGFQDGDVSDVYTTAPIPTTAIIDGVNRLRVWRTPSGALLWINDSPVGLIKASPFSGGFVGVAAFGGADVSGPITLIADNFRVLER